MYGDKATKPARTVRGLVGLVFERYFEADPSGPHAAGWYRGTVTQYNNVTDTHRIVYPPNTGDEDATEVWEVRRSHTSPVSGITQCGGPTPAAAAAFDTRSDTVGGDSATVSNPSPAPKNIGKLEASGPNAVIRWVHQPSGPHPHPPAAAAAEPVKPKAADEAKRKPEDAAEGHAAKKPSLERTVLRLVDKCISCAELVETLMEHPDSAAIVKAVLHKLGAVAPTEETEGEAKVFEALVCVLAAEATDAETAALAVAAVAQCDRGSDADALSTALLRTALRFPDLAKPCATAVSAVRGSAGGIAAVTWSA